VLQQLAAEGMEEQLPPLLSTLLQDWAIKEAAKLLLRCQSDAIDPAEQGLQRAFWDKLQREHQALSSELLLQLQRGKEQRARAQTERAQSWQTVAVQSLEQQRSQQQHWHNAALQWVQGQQQMNQQWFQHEQQMFGHYQQVNQQWAQTALTGVQQAQLGIKQWYDFAATTQQHVVNMLAGSEQRQTALVEQAVHKANVRKWATRLTVISLVLIGIVALFGCAFFAMLHLY
jgi:hypothetical protein